MTIENADQNSTIKKKKERKKKKLKKKEKEELGAIVPLHMCKRLSETLF